MGILDDAIREHLDLKRQHGADDSEVQQLEDEAFGPPTRPGEPDFPESQEQPAVEGADEPPAFAGHPASEDPTTLLESSTPAVAEPPPPQGLPSGPDLKAEEAVAEPPAEAGPEPVAQPPQEELPAEAAPFFDQAHEEPPEPAQPISEEHPIETLETVEHPMEEPLAEEGGVEITEAELAEGAATETAPGGPETGDEVLAPETGEESLPPETGEAPLPPETGEEPLPPETGEHPEAEDVLEETPEFLRDQPEDDELWFEQGEPKDFDF